MKREESQEQQAVKGFYSCWRIAASVPAFNDEESSGLVFVTCTS